MQVSITPIYNDQQFSNSSGNPLSGGKIYTYAAGSNSILKTTYSDAAGLVPNTNPIVFNSSGRCGQIWLQDGVSYNLVLKDSSNNTISSADNISGVLMFNNAFSSATGSSMIGFESETVQSILYKSRPLASYTNLRNYTGNASVVSITNTGISGYFSTDGSTTHTSAEDDGGTSIVDSNNRLWKRLYVGDIKTEWFGIFPDGNDYSTLIKKALDVSVALGTCLIFGPGTYVCSTISIPTYTSTVRIKGSSKTGTTIQGATTKNLFKLSGGGGFYISNIGFKTWEAVVRLNSNAGGISYETFEFDSCYFEGIDISSVSDSSAPADGGIKEVRFTRNTVYNCGMKNSVNSAGIRLDSNLIYSAYIHDNEINNIGGVSYSGQKDGISIGAVTTSDLCTVSVTNNRIYNVITSGTGHCSGITVFGPRTKVTGNTINTVYGSVTNVDQYGIYTKSSFSTITENVLIDAGGNAACIMTKGFPNDLNPPSLNAQDFNNVIADNTINIVTRNNPTIKYSGIVTYNGGMNIHDNIIKGTNEGIIEISLLNLTYGTRTGNYIHDNKIDGLYGAASSTVIGITSNNPFNTTIKDNLIGAQTALGTGVESTVYGISITNSGSYTLGYLSIIGNSIRSLSAATTLGARGINITFDSGGIIDDVNVLNNYVSGVGICYNITYAGTIGSFNYCNNTANNFTVSGHRRSGGTVPASGVWNANILNGVDYRTLTAGETVPSSYGTNHLQTANTASTTILGIAEGCGTQMLLIEFDSFTTINNSATIKLASASLSGANGGMLTLKKIGSVFKEVSRTVY